jgi:hypothetical protein
MNRLYQILFLVVCVFGCLSLQLSAQDGRGDRGRGGGPPFGGGPPGGFRGGGSSFGGGFSPADMLRRFDENGNGMIDPAESQGRAGFFLQRIASQIPQLDLSRPVPIDRLATAMQRLREQRDSGEGRSDDRGGDRGRSSGRSSSSSSRSSPTVEPLVPGFGLEEELELPLGFGAEGELFAVTVIDRDKREADERFRRYDSNRDGFLDRQEISRGRWSDDPYAYDRNHDGKLTPSEMAVRYARRRIAQEGSSSTSGRSSSGSSSSRSSSSGGDSRVEAMLRGIFDRYDSNKNGVFEKSEWGNFRTPPNDADRNRDGKITREEMAPWLAARFGGGSRGGGDSGRGFGRSGFGGGREGDPRSFYSRGDSKDQSRSSGRGENSDQPRKSYRVKTATERLPKELLDRADWFARDDANADGQVALREFAASFSDSILRDFAQFDLNRDGFITSSECLEAINNGAQRGSATSSSTTVASQPEKAPSTTSKVSVTTKSNSKASTTPSGKADARYLKYSRGLIKRYDSNSDGMLVADEWRSMSRDYSSADTDGDGKITVEELAIKLKP